MFLNKQNMPLNTRSYHAAKAHFFICSSGVERRAPMEERTSDDRKRHESTDDMYDALGDFGHPRRGCPPSDISSTSSEEDEPVPKRSAPQTRKKAPGTRPWMSAARRRRHDAEEARRRRAAEFGWLRDPRERVHSSSLECCRRGFLFFFIVNFTKIIL